MEKNYPSNINSNSEKRNYDRTNGILLDPKTEAEKLNDQLVDVTPIKYKVNVGSFPSNLYRGTMTNDNNWAYDSASSQYYLPLQYKIVGDGYSLISALSGYSYSFRSQILYESIYNDLYSTNFNYSLIRNSKADNNNFNSGVGCSNTVYSTVIKSNGNILLGGGFSTYSGATVNNIIELNGDGTIYNTYGYGFNDTIRSIAIQSDNKIITGGDFGIFNASPINRIVGLNADETIDTTFITGTGFNGNYVTCLASQSDGKILAGGDFTTYNGVTANYIIRLNADGSKDTTFVTGTGFNNRLETITLQSDGKILVGGIFTTYSGATANRIIRLNTDGTIDTTFTSGAGFNNTVNSIKLQSDGKIIVGGDFTSYSGVSSNNNRIIRLNANGTKDTTFVTGTGFGGAIYSIAIQSDEKILVSGNFTSYSGASNNNRIIRLNTNGTKDTTFVTGAGFDSAPTNIEIQSDGKIILSGNFTSYSGVSSNNNRIIRLNANGTKDTTFVTGTGFGATVKSLLLQSDGKILVGGEFTSYSGVTANRIIRLNTDGTIDSTIGAGAGGTVLSLAILPNNKIIVGGQYTTFGGTLVSRLARLNTNGTIDSSFVVGTGFNGNIDSVKLQSDGKILVGGGFSTYNGTTANKIIRLNTDGTIDTTFSSAAGFNSSSSAIDIQSDGKILVGGGFTTYSGVTANRIIRLNTDGTIDTTFTSGSGFNSNTYSVKVQSDGKILVGGGFTTYNGVTVNNIIRLNTDGTKDTTFVTGTGFNGAVNSITVQSDGKIYVGGAFTTYNGATSNRIIKLNANGTKDNTYGTGFGGTVNSLALQSDEKIIAGGEFTSYQGITKNRIIRLMANGSIDSKEFIYFDQLEGGLLYSANVFSLGIVNGLVSIISDSPVKSSTIDFTLIEKYGSL